MLNFSSRETWAQSRKPKPSTRLADYATPEQITALKSALITRFKRVAGLTADDIRFKRACIRAALRAIDKGKLPSLSEAATEDLLANIRARYEAAKADAHNEIASDDAAWNAEKERRAKLQARYGTSLNTQKETHL